MNAATKYIAPAIGDHFIMVLGQPETEVVVTDVQIIPDGFMVEGMPLDRDPDDYSIYARKYIDNYFPDVTCTYCQTSYPNVCHNHR